MQVDPRIARVAPTYFDGVLRTQTDAGLIRVELTVPAAIRLREALAVVGGDAALAARMLGESLDSMVEEIQHERHGASALVSRATRFLSAATL